MSQDWIVSNHHSNGMVKRVTLNPHVEAIYNITAKPVDDFDYGMRNQYYGYGSNVINAFDIMKIYEKAIHPAEDWYVEYIVYMCNKNIPPDFGNLRHRSMHKFYKIHIDAILRRLVFHKILKRYYDKDIYKKSHKGEVLSFFRPYQTIHVDFTPKGYDLIQNLNLSHPIHYPYNFSPVV